MSRTSLRAPAWMLALALAPLGGCGILDFFISGSDEASGPAGPAAPAAKVERARDALDLAIEAQAEYVYNPVGKRDPFRSFLVAGERTTSEQRVPTQKYELDQYALVGIIWGVDRPRALVEDPEGVGHVMELGTYIGKNWGKVTQISADKVVVTEEYTTLDGELSINNIALTLPNTGDGSVR
jgi:type IV pilus assembly protein PilP